MGKIRESYRDWVRNLDGIQGFESRRSISARIGKHYCPYCNDLLQIRIKNRIVNSESEDAKHFNFSAYEGSMIGNVKFSWDVFYCGNCNIEIPIGDILIYERKLKKAEGNLDFDEFRKGSSPSNKIIRGWFNYLVMGMLIGSAIFMIIFLIKNIWIA